jgi:hypothetical protein
MSSAHGYGAEVDPDDIRSALEPTRKLRLALDVLWGELPGNIGSETTEKSLWELHDRICAAELSALRSFGLTRQYIIIRPLNMMKLPDSETMQKITSAIQVLDDLGLIAGPGEV